MCCSNCSHLSPVGQSVVEVVKSCELNQGVLRRDAPASEVDFGLDLKPETQIVNEDKGVRFSKPVPFAKVREEPDIWFTV